MSSKDIVILKRDEDSSCKIHIFGATLFSWINNGEEMIFVSSKSHFDKKKAIRGGIPLVFPNFGPWELGPQHGFARIMSWTTTGQCQDENGNPMVVLTLQDNDETRKMWNFKFQLTYTVTLQENMLKTDFAVCNEDEKEFDFTCLLHTYLKVPDVTKSTVSGLQGLTYIDKVRDEASFIEDRELVTISENVDRMYQGTASEHTVSGAGGCKTVIIRKTNLPDTVVWNPWKEKAAAMSDFTDDQYPTMLCVEAGYVANRKVLSSGDKFESSQLMCVV